jgi:hypothetical protein
MARPNDPRAAAARVKTEVAASRLNDELETQLAMGDPDPEWARRAEEARADLAQRFGGYDRLHTISNDRPKGTSEARRPRRGSTAPHSGRRRPASSASSAAPAAPASPPPSGRAPASTRKPAPRTTRRAPRAGLGRGAGARALRQTGIPGAAGSTSAFALQVLGLMIGMALLYLALTSAERGRGGGIIGQILTGSTSLLHRFISPGDPLAARPKPATAAAGVPILQPGETNAHFDQRMNTYLRSRAQPDPSAGAVLRGTTRPLGGFPATTTP